MEKINTAEAILFLVDVLYCNWPSQIFVCLDVGKFRIQELIKFTREVGYFMVQKLRVRISRLVIYQLSL